MLTALYEGQPVRARRRAKSSLSETIVEAGEIGVVAGIGPVWDGPSDLHVGVTLESGLYIANPVAYANNLWEPA